MEGATGAKHSDGDPTHPTKDRTAHVPDGDDAGAGSSDEVWTASRHGTDGRTRSQIGRTDGNGCASCVAEGADGCRDGC